MAKTPAEPKIETTTEKYDRISKRIGDAVEEVNAALEDAFEEGFMTVGMGIMGGSNDESKNHPSRPWKPAAPAKLYYWTGRIGYTSLPVTADLRWRWVGEAKQDETE